MFILRYIAGNQRNEQWTYFTASSCSRAKRRSAAQSNQAAVNPPNKPTQRNFSVWVSWDWKDWTPQGCVKLDNINNNNNKKEGTWYFKKGAAQLESVTAHHKQVQRRADVMLNPQRMKECPELKTVYVTVWLDKPVNLFCRKYIRLRVFIALLVSRGRNQMLCCAGQLSDMIKSPKSTWTVFFADNLWLFMHL